MLCIVYDNVTFKLLDFNKNLPKKNIEICDDLIENVGSFDVDQ